jgi:hypothetical protein
MTRKPPPIERYVDLFATPRDYGRVCAACAGVDVDQPGWLCLPCAEESAAWRVSRPVWIRRGWVMITWG